MDDGKEVEGGADETTVPDAPEKMPTGEAAPEAPEENTDGAVA